MHYSNLKISSKTSICCVIGHPIDNSLSPIMHNVAFYFTNLDYIYVAFDVKESLGEAVKGLRALGVRGFNITMPHKVSIINFLDSIDKNATLVGAVNTVVNNNNTLIGYNTDVDGVISAFKTKDLRQEIGDSLNGLNALIIGAGGAARASIVALVSKGCKKISIFNRTINKAKRMMTELSQKLDIFYTVKELKINSLKRALSSADILINATSIGAYPRIDESIIPLEFLKKDLIVFDVVYKPKKTKLLIDAEQIGAKIIPGYKMFVGQGARSFEIWTGMNAPIDIMKKAVLEALE